MLFRSNGLLAGILLNSKAVDFVVTGCGTGMGSMLACNAMPGVFCGLVIDPTDAFLFGLTSVHWREAWKYGERAFRYCQHDAGHAVGAARIAAATLGWKAAVLDGVSDDQIATLLGTGRAEDFQDAEREHPDCLLAVWPEALQGSTSGTVEPVPLDLDADAIRVLAHGQWIGRANRLKIGRAHV